MTTFAELGLPAAITNILERDGITSPFPIQLAAIPDALAGRDVCGRAPTGSGKTFAFGLPMLVGLERARPNRPQALVLVPTRELADQIRAELAPFAKAMGRSIAVVYGGVGYGPQRSALRKGADLVIACPGRLEDLIGTGEVRLDDLDIVTIDEADRMADMGFLPAVRRILDLAPSDRQTLLFSATLDGDVKVLTDRYQRDARRHEAAPVETLNSDVAHHFWRVERDQRLSQTAAILDASSSTIVFTRTRHGADRLVKQLEREGVASVALHGGKSQPQRTRALAAFTSGRAKALIATDVAARGIHVDDVESVVHFDPPEDAKAYVHRSGRTARAGATGAVYSFVDRSQTRDANRMIRELDLPTEIGAPDAPSTFTRREPRVLTPVRAEAPVREEGRGEKGRGVRSDGPSRGSDDVEGNIYVANLPYSMTSSELADLFTPFGPVQQAAIVTHPKTTRSRGFGFVAMPDADRAIEELHGSEIAGRVLTVREARPRS
ncbi:MAG TPA: DEAD/DEAH box helicase [Acidimicrobiia bacterium]|nr:DEAD/DEAH box helicase [Acidimicrobiia bacterium]